MPIFKGYRTFLYAKFRRDPLHLLSRSLGPLTSIESNIENLSTVFVHTGSDTMLFGFAQGHDGIKA
jgi:hypothetical protein